MIGRDLKPTEFYVKLGHTSQPFDKKGTNYNVSRIYIHPDFNQTHDLILNDIALITVESRIVINKYVNPICLPEPQLFNKLKQKDNLTLSGFGYAYDPMGRIYKPTYLQMTGNYWV